MSLLKQVLAVGACVGVCSLAAAGPDVVVSNITGTQKYGTKDVDPSAGVDLVTGYAVGTVSCNIGDAIAEWFEFSSRHPVIGTQFYRLHNGRFEMIGMNWLKHGYCAADAPSCTNLGPPGAAYQPQNSCDWLGLYATDTYGSSLNGTQSDCGPRSEINAAAGTCPYPWTLGWQTSGDCIYKRLQLHNNDLNPANYPGARFFTEVHYVTTDEVAGVRHNNASYRETLIGSLSNGPTGTGCTTTNQGYTLSFTGNVVPLKPAIEAWRTIDPTVTLVATDISNDGRVIVGAKVTDLGGGQWQYEYAVYNHNSHRCVGSFSIQKTSDPGASFTSLGFHDVEYHSGEPYSGTDWPGAVDASTIAWATEPFASNANANAIRFSTTYNFRFQSNLAPTTGSVTLGLFRPGTPASIDVGGLPVPSMPTFCPADFNRSGGAPTVQDLFDFLAAYFAGDPAADFNGAGGISVQDIFDFIEAYFVPCP